MSFCYEIHTAKGCLLTGCDADFLAVVFRAKEAKARALALLPYSRFRALIVYPNGSRVSKADLKAALQALSDSAISAAVAQRARANARRADRRNEDRTAGASHASFSVGAGRDFCQAGVVAPPDSLTGETRPEIWKGKWAGRFSVKSGASNGL